MPRTDEPRPAAGDRGREGHRRPRRFRACRSDLRDRAKYRHQRAADDDLPGRSAQAWGADRRGQSDARTRAHSLHRAAGRRPDGDLWLDPGCERIRARENRRRPCPAEGHDARAVRARGGGGGGDRPRVYRRTYRGLRGVARRHPGTGLGRDRRRVGHFGGADPPLRRNLHPIERDDHLLRHGIDPAPAGFAAVATGRQLAVVEGPIWQARCGYLADPRAFERPGRPHGGDRRTAEPDLPRSRARRLRLRTAARPRASYGRIGRSDAGGDGQGLHRARRQLRSRGPRYPASLCRDGETRPDRRYRHKAQSRTSDPWSRRADPACRRAIRAYRDRRGRTIRDDRGFDVECHGVAGGARSGKRASDARGRDRLPHGDGDVARKPGRLDALHRRL